MHVHATSAHTSLVWQWILYLDHAKRACFQRETSTRKETYGVVAGVTAQSEPLCTSRSLPKGAWTHVAAVYDYSSKKRTVLLNGTVANSDEQRDDAHDDPETPLIIGAHLDRHMPAGLFHGEIDDVRVWSQARALALDERSLTRILPLTRTLMTLAALDSPEL